MFQFFKAKVKPSAATQDAIYTVSHAPLAGDAPLFSFYLKVQFLSMPLLGAVWWGWLCCIQDLKGQDSGDYAPLMRGDPERGRVSLTLLDLSHTSLSFFTFFFFFVGLLFNTEPRNPFWLWETFYG